MRSYDATSGIAALDQITARRRMLNNSKTNATIELHSPQGEIHLNYELIIEQGDYWQLKLEGPLGVDIALIELSRNRWEMKDIQAGEVLRGEMDDSLYISSLDIWLPPLKHLASLLLPIPDIAYPQEWHIKTAEVVPAGKLILVSSLPGLKERRELDLNYAPLQILQERVFIDGNSLITRMFNYDNSSSVLPEKTTSRMGNWSMDVKYHKVHVYRGTGSNTPVAPL